MGCSCSVNRTIKPEEADSTSQQQTNVPRKFNQVNLRPKKYQKLADSQTGLSKSKLSSLLSSLSNTNGIFEDPEFPAKLSSIIIGNTNHEYYKDFAASIWRRPHEIFRCEYDQIKVFEDINANDILQGILGVCYLLASLSALAEFPERLKKIYLSQTANKHGIYGLMFYVQGIPTEILIDDRFPCVGKNPAHRPLFSSPKGKELWVLLAEKAWAKLFKNYVAAEAGLMHEALEYLTGAPSFGYVPQNQEPEEIWKLLSVADSNKHIICAATTADVPETTGLVAGHAYTVEKVFDFHKYKIIKLRNPWGSFEWKGDFGDSSPLWTPELKEKLGYSNQDDGVFCITLKDFRHYFDQYSICVYHDDWEYSYIEVESFSNHAEYFKFHVDKPCEVFFRIHQRDSRHLPAEQRESFEYSSVDLIVTKIEEDGTYKPILDSPQNIDPSAAWGARSVYPSSTGKVIISEAGDYIIRTKVRWRYAKKDKFTLSAYATFKIDIQHVTSIKDFLTNFYINLGRANPEKDSLGFGCKLAAKFYGQYMYVYVENTGNKGVILDVKFSSLINLRLGKLHRKGVDVMEMIVQPEDESIAYIKQIKPGEECKYLWDYSARLIHV